jgi:hypothetical protein
MKVCCKKYEAKSTFLSYPPTPLLLPPHNFSERVTACRRQTVHVSERRARETPANSGTFR